MATELTYPSPESTVTGLMFGTSQIFGVGLTIALSEIMTRFGTFYSILTQITVLSFGTILTFLTPNQLKRQAAFHNDVIFEKVSTQEKLEL